MQTFNVMASEKRFDSEPDPKYANPNQKYIQQLIKPVEFCDIRIFKGIKPCITVERFLKFTSANFDILGTFSDSMDINDLVNKCIYRFDNTSFICNHEKMGNGDWIDLKVEYFPRVKAIRIERIYYYTCSPAWEDIKGLIIKKYASRSFKYEDWNDRSKIDFYADAVNHGRLEVSHSSLSGGGRRGCPGNSSLTFNLWNWDVFSTEINELEKRISKDAAKKTPIPSF